MKKNVCYPSVKDGETFEIAGFEFIKFPSVDGETPIVMRDYAFESPFGGNNDLRHSHILNKMESEILPKIVAEVGEENICTIRTDLTTLDGLKSYGVMESLISLPTIDFYRANGDIFSRYKPSRWCWLATPESASPNGSTNWILCVSRSGIIIYGGYYGRDFGVRPILILKSTIFESSVD